MFNVHGKVAQAIDLERLTNAAEDKQHLHLNLLTPRADGPNDVMEKTEIACPYVRDVRVSVDGSTVEPLRVKSIFRSIKSLGAGFGLHPDFPVFADMAQSASLRVDDRNLSADRDHAGVLDEKSGRIRVRIDGVNEPSPQRSCVEPQFYGLDAHVGA